MRPRRVLSLAATCGALALAAPPTANGQASAWTAPEPIGGAADAFPELVVAPGGRVTAAWTASAAAGPESSLAAADAEGRFAAGRPLAPGFAIAGIGTFAGDGIVVAGTTGRLAPRPAVVTGTVDAPGRPRPLLEAGERGAVLDLAVGARGDAAVLLTRCRNVRCVTHDVLLRVRRGTAAFGPAAVVRRAERVQAGAVAIDDRGGVVAAWEEPRRGTNGTRLILARRRTAGGRLGAVERLGSAVPSVGLRAGHTADRRPVVAWIGQAVSEGDALGAATIRLAAAPSPRAPFAPAQRLERVDVRGTGRYVGQAGVRLAAHGPGGMLVAWTGFAHDRFVVRAGELEGVRVVRARVLSDPARDTVLSDAAAAADGRAVVLGLEGLRGADPSGPVRLVAAVRGAGGAFGPLEALTAQGPFVEAGRVVIDPVWGHAVAVWRDPTLRTVLTARRGLEESGG